MVGAINTEIIQACIVIHSSFDFDTNLTNIFSGAADHIRKINSNGVKKMCRNIFAVQHTLTSSITGSRETSLDHAKQYYEMFNQRQQEVLSGIIEKGPIFSAEEYVATIKLLYR